MTGLRKQTMSYCMRMPAIANLLASFSNMIGLAGLKYWTIGASVKVLLVFRIPTQLPESIPN